jgi:uncharacterized SAM-binding protein YcdF (DUF218 family)
MRLVRWVLWSLGIIVAFLLAFYLAHPIILPAYARLFHKQNATKNADAIICLSGGRTSRVGESLRLWNQGYSKKLFVTAEKPKNSEFAKLELGHLKFAQAVTKMMKLNAEWEILPSLTGGATSTFDEAEDALFYATEKNWKRIIIVTEEFHTRRAHYAFEKIFANSGIDVEVAGASNEVFSIDNWWKSDRGIMAYFGETIKFPVYLLWDSEPQAVKNH